MTARNNETTLRFAYYAVSSLIALAFNQGLCCQSLFKNPLLAWTLSSLDRPRSGKETGSESGRLLGATRRIKV